MHIHSIPVGCFVFLVLCLNIQAQEAVCIQSQPGSLIIELSLDSVWVTADGQIRSSPSLPSAYFSTGLPLPVYREFFPDLPENARVRVFPGRTRSFSLKSSPTVILEQGKGVTLEGPQAPLPPRTDQLFSVAPSSVYPGSVVTLYPLHQVGNAIVWRPHLSLVITWPATRGPTLQPLSKTRLPGLGKPVNNRRDFSGPPVPDYQYSPNLARICVDHEGWYALTYADLIDNNVLISGLDPRTFRLWDRDRECSLIVEGESDGIFSPGDRIIFRGQPAPPPEDVTYRSNFYSPEHWYWLTWGSGAGQRYVEESSYPEAPLNEVYHPDSFTDTLHVESNDYFARLGSRNLHSEWDRFDHFFMAPPIQGGQSVDFNLKIDYPTLSTEKRFSLSAEFQGITGNVHQLQITLNHIVLGASNWTDQGSLLFETDPGQVLTNAALHHGDNVFTCTLSGGDPTNRYDQVYLNWVDLVYDREFRAVNNELAFRRDSELPITNQYQISGFTSPDIFIVKAGLTRLTDFLIIPAEDKYTVVFQDYTGSDRPQYRLFTGDQIEAVQRIIPEEPLNPLCPSIATDYLILAPDSFRTTLQPLADFHGAQIIDINDVYREYSGGQIDPRAIKTFLKDMWSQGVSGLRYVLIAMQGKWFGWEGNNEARQAFIPAMKIQTYGFGAVASDTWYTLVNGDDYFPDFAIGRFPARNREELEIMVAKTMQFLTRNDRTGDNRLLMIGGYETTFKDQSEALIDPILEQGYFPKRLYIDRYSEEGPFFGNTDTLISVLNRGLWYLNFLGHGGGAVWGDRSLLTLDDLPRLSNAGQTPIVTSMTCFTGDVTNPDALGRRMVSLPAGGATAWLGSAGVGWIINDFLLLEPIHRHLFSDENWTLGELINQGKIEDLATNLGFPDIAKTQLYQFNLTGDPALPIRRPQNAEITVSPPVVSGGEQITVSGIDPAADSLVVHLYDRDNLPRGQFQTPTMTLPPSTPAGGIRINAAWKEGTRLRHGSALAGVEGSLVRVVEISPQFPSELDSIQIIVEAADPWGLDSVFVRVNGKRIPLPVRTANDRYTRKSPLSPFPAGATVFIQPGVINTLQQETWGPSLTLTIQPAIAPQVTALTFFVEDELGLQAEVSNTTTGAGNIRLIFEEQADSVWQEVGRVEGKVAGINSKTFQLATALDRGSRYYRVILPAGPGFSADTLEKEITPTAFWVTPKLGTTGDRVHHQVVGIPSFDIEVPPGEVLQAEILSLDTLFREQVPPQGGLQLFVAEDGPPAIEWRTGRKIDLTTFWTVTLPDTETPELFIYDPTFQVWERVANPGQSISWTGPGGLAWFTIQDREMPGMEVSVNGQHFLQDGFLSAAPRIAVVAQDNNGMDFRPEAMKCWLNRDYNDSRAPFRVSGRGTVATYEFAPELTEADTLLELQVQDAVGNVSDTLGLHFRVRSDLDLLDYGNYPNPFKDQTRFTYELTDNVDQFSLDIYTVSGRRIRHFGPQSTLTDLDSRSGAYHEIIWDGRDSGGRFVANGVYFYRYRVTKGKRILSRQGKVAKAR